MMLRGLATVVLVGLFGLNLVMPTSPMLARGRENLVRADVASQLMIGKPLPPFALIGFDGREYSREDLLGHRVLLTFERSLDW